MSSSYRIYCMGGNTFVMPLGALHLGYHTFKSMLTPDLNQSTFNITLNLTVTLTLNLCPHKDNLTGAFVCGW